jgi:hypothetical protein
MQAFAVTFIVPTMEDFQKIEKIGEGKFKL